MPQPYLPTFSNKRYSVGFQAINDRPALASVIGKCVGIWSYVDNGVGNLFGILLGVDSEATHRVFLTLRKAAKQLEALDAAAIGKRLSDDEKTVYSGIINEYGSLEKQRNKLAHGLFGICPDDEDLLFVIGIDRHVLWQADIIPKLDRGEIPADPHEGLKEHLYVYRLSDLESLHRQMEQLWWDLFYFNGYLRNSQNSLRIAEFQRLVASARPKNPKSRFPSSTEPS
jgi:hypothetical protein